MKERCPCCKKYINYSLIQSSPHPDAEGCCYECLPADMQKAYDEFFGHNEPKRDSLMTDSGNEQPWTGTV